MRYRIELTYRNKRQIIKTIEARSDAEAWQKAELHRPTGGTVRVVGQREGKGAEKDE